MSLCCSLSFSPTPPFSPSPSAKPKSPRPWRGTCKKYSFVVFYAVKSEIFICLIMNNQDILVGEKLKEELAHLPDKHRSEIESWIVNNLKVKILRKFESYFDQEGVKNLKELLLVPLFTVSDLSERVKTLAPELKTLYFKELVSVFEEAEERLIKH